MRQSVMRVVARARAARLGEEGASLVEYSLLVAFIAVVAILAVTSFGQEVSSTFDSAIPLIPGG